MIILSTKLLTLPVLLSILLCIAKGQSVEELCEKHEKELEKKGGAVTEVLWEESLEKKENKEEEKERLEEQKKTEKAKEKDANAKNVSWLSTFIGNYFCQKLRKKDEEQKKKQNVPKKFSSKTPKVSVPLITKMDTDDKSDKRYEAEFAVKSEEEIFEKIRDKFNISDEQLLLSLSELVPLNGRGGSGGVFYKTKDDKFILKSLNPDHDEPAKIDEVLDNYSKHVLGQQPEKGKQSTDSRSMMNTFFMYFEMNVYAKLKEGKGKERKKKLRLHMLQFVVLNNVFEGIDEQTLLKFDIKGTFAPGSAVQHDQKQKWYTGETGWQKSLYREYDFIGISREGREISAFFPEGIQLLPEAYRQLADGVKNDTSYLTENGVNDYSLLLGVQFMDPYSDPPEDRKDSEGTKKGAKCVEAKCHNCKRRPDAKYEEKATLCLYMGIIDIVTPSNEKTEKHFLEMMQQHRADRADFTHYQSMSEFTPYHNEIVTPVPPQMYGKRFVGTVLGCLFSPESSTSVGGESERQFQLGMRQSICKTFGEKRGIKTNHGIEVFGLNMFKEMMEKREQSAWEMLNSFSDSLLPSQNLDEFVIEQIEDEQFFNFGSASNSKINSQYFGLFRNGKKYYAVVRNANAKKQKTKASPLLKEKAKKDTK